MAPKACILCGGPPPLTGEHIFPDWYNRQQPKTRYQLESSFTLAGPTSVRQTQSLNLQPKVLCVRCNGVWGSRLEDRVAPILRPMIRGEAQTLRRNRQQLLSAWFCLKSMAAEYLAPPPRLGRFYATWQRKHLRATLRPPQLVNIWLGRYVGSMANAGRVDQQGSSQQISESPAAAVRWHSTTYSIGQTLLHLFAMSAAIPLEPLGNREELDRLNYVFPWRPGDWNSTLLPIWPLPKHTVRWPPAQAFDDEGFDYLKDRWQKQEEGADTPREDAQP